MKTSKKCFIAITLSFLMYGQGCLAEDSDPVLRCQSNWFASSAYKTCQTPVMMNNGSTLYEIVNANSPGCLIKVGCLNQAQRQVSTEFQGAPDQVTTLNNCNGTLRPGGC